MHKQAKQVLLARSSRRNAGGSENNRDKDCGGSMRQSDRGGDADADSSKERGTRNAYEKRPLSLELKNVDVINLHRGSPDVKQNDQRGTGMERRKSEIVRADRGKIGEGGMHGGVGCGKDKDREGAGKRVKQVEEQDNRISMLARRHLKTRGEKESEGAQETGSKAAMGLDGFSAGCGGWVSSLSTRSLSTRSLSSRSLSSSENMFWHRHSDADALDADAQFPTAVRVNQKSSG
jgi:hypothetical protein